MLDVCLRTSVARSDTALYTTHLCDSPLYQSGKRVSLHNIHVLSVSRPVLSFSVLHAQLFVVPGYTLRAWWRSLWLLYVDSRQYIMTTTDELLARLVNLENEAVQPRQRQPSGTRVGGSPTPYPAVILRSPARQQESSIHALLASRSRSLVKLRNGQRGNSRSLRSRVQRIRG